MRNARQFGTVRTDIAHHANDAEPLNAGANTIELSDPSAYTPDFDRIIGLNEDGKIDTRPWITHRSGFDELIGVFPSYTKPETGVIKAVVEVGE